MNNVDGGNNKYLVDSGFVVLIMLLGRLGFSSIDLIVLVFVCIRMRIITMRNMWVVNR